MSDKNIFLMTKRLIFKKIDDEDIESLYKLYHNDELTKYFVAGSDISLEHTMTRIQNIKSHWNKYGFGDFILLDKENLSTAGYGGLHYKIDGGNVNVSYIIDRNLWGNGLGREACLALVYYGFNALNLDKIVAEIDPDNANSIRLIEKCGFKFNRITEWKKFERLEYIMSGAEFKAIEKELLSGIDIIISERQ